jgi:hypothetical protein
LEARRSDELIGTRLVDERDTDREIASPVYRVCFWEQANVPQDVAPEHAGYRSTEHEPTNALNIHEVLAWAHDNAGPNRTFVLCAVVDRCRIHLAGIDPTRATDS